MRDNQKFIISVKTRFKYERLGGLNPRFNLGVKWREKLKKAESLENATPSWVAIQIEDETYTAYFGLISLIEESNGIPMQPEACKYYECLAKNEAHSLNICEYKPSYQIKVEGNLK